MINRGDRRFGGKFIQTSVILEDLIKKNITKKGFGNSNLLFQWQDIVGAEIGIMTRPLKIVTSKDKSTTKLIIQVFRAYTSQVSLCLDFITQRVNQFYGYNAISKVIMKQTGPYNLEHRLKLFLVKLSYKRFFPKINRGIMLKS